MARKSPLSKLKDAAIETIKDPVGATRQRIGGALSAVAGTAETVSSLVTGRTSSTPADPPQGRGDSSPFDAVARSSAGPVARKSAGSAKPAGDPVAPDTATSVPVAKKSAAKKAPVKKAAAKKSAVKKAPARKTTAATRTATKKATASAAMAEIAAASDVDTSAPDEVPAQKTPAKKSPTRKAATTKKAAKKTSAQPTPAPPVTSAPTPSATPALPEEPTVTTPVGTPGAGEGTNPDTTDHDLQQPDTAPIADEATANAIISEAEMLAKDADPDK